MLMFHLTIVRMEKFTYFCITIKRKNMKKCTYTIEQYPVLTGKLKDICDSQKEREELILFGINSLNFLVEYNIEFRLCY